MKQARFEYDDVLVQQQHDIKSSGQQAPDDADRHPGYFAKPGRVAKPLSSHPVSKYLIFLQGKLVFTVRHRLSFILVKMRICRIKPLREIPLYQPVVVGDQNSWQHDPCRRHNNHIYIYMNYYMILISIYDDFGEMKSKAIIEMPPSVRQGHVKLGRDIEIARKRRRITQRAICDRASISISTYQRLVAGDAEISIGVFSMVLQSIGMDDRLFQSLDAASDVRGIALDQDRLPKAIRRKKTDLDPRLSD